MRIDNSKIPSNLFDEVSLPQCKYFREQAENIVTLLKTLSPITYDSMGEFDKILIAEYWRHFDGLAQKLETRSTVNISQFIIFRDWFVKGATNPEHIRRARQWLVENGILIPNSVVQEKAQVRAGEVRAGIGSSKRA